MPFYHFSDPPSPYYPYNPQQGGRQINSAEEAFIIAKEMRKAERRARRELLGQQEADKKKEGEKKKDDPPKKWFQKLSGLEIFLAMICSSPFVMVGMSILQIAAFQHLKDILNTTFK